MPDQESAMGAALDGEMSQDVAAVDFSKGAVTGTIEIPESWSGGTLNLVFDNKGAKLRRRTITYELTVDATEAN